MTAPGHRPEKRHPQQWERHLAVRVVKPHGWGPNSAYGSQPWGTPITCGEFWARAAASECETPPPNTERLNMAAAYHAVREVAEAQPAQALTPAQLDWIADAIRDLE